MGKLIGSVAVILVAVLSYHVGKEVKRLEIEEGTKEV